MVTAPTTIVVTNMPAPGEREGGREGREGKREGGRGRGGRVFKDKRAFKSI